jgi:DNA-binding IscR family transcriptional regulator
MIPTTSGYPLRTLSCLAWQANGSPVLGHDLAGEANVPANYLSKILLSLKRAGLVSTATGEGIACKRLHIAHGSTKLLTFLTALPAAKAACAACCSPWHDVRAAYNHFLTATALAGISQWPSAPEQH